ncbi:hypothetical protein [Mycobacterium uberis]|uniref:hypothetical protein n=1 Tax=Mycobacterium uberis TaxID=2162698 RepID=UPI000E30936B
MFDDLLLPYRLSAALGMVLALMFVVGHWILSLLSQWANWAAAVFVDQTTNQLYVMLSV